MPGELDELIVNVPCPECGSELTKTFRELKTHTNFVCANCGQNFDSANFKADIQKAEKAIDDLRRKIIGTTTRLRA